MSTWRVSQHYGFGAARIPIQPRFHVAANPSLRDGLAGVLGELAEGGPGAVARRILGQSPAILLGLLLLATFLATLLRDHSDVSPVEIVAFELPVPEELVAEPAPPPVPEPEPRPAPPPPQLAELPPPAAPPVPVEIARVEPPPPPQSRALQREPVPPRAAPRPRLELDAVAVQTPTPAEAPNRPSRVVQVDPRRRTPALSAPLAPRPSVPDEVAAQRSFRMAAAAPTRSARPAPVAPRVAPPRNPAAVPVPRSRTTSPAPPARADRAPVRTPERVAAVRPPSLAAPSAVAGRTPVERAAPEARATRRALPTPSTSGAARPVAEVARAPRAARAAAPVPSPARRVRNAPASMTPKGNESARAGLAGVPLGELVACVSDREEDRLKQAVVAAVTTQRECRSRAGTYRFVETKNLNSFLMWIDRASDRTVGDRCDELQRALECLRGSGRAALGR